MLVHAELTYPCIQDTTVLQSSESITMGTIRACCRWRREPQDGIWQQHTELWLGCWTVAETPSPTFSEVQANWYKFKFSRRFRLRSLGSLGVLDLEIHTYSPSLRHMQHTRGATPRHFQFDSSGRLKMQCQSLWNTREKSVAMLSGHTSGFISSDFFLSICSLFDLGLLFAIWLKDASGIDRNCNNGAGIQSLLSTGDTSQWPYYCQCWTGGKQRKQQNQNNQSFSQRFLLPKESAASTVCAGLLRLSPGMVYQYGLEKAPKSLASAGMGQGQFPLT